MRGDPPIQSQPTARHDSCVAQSLKILMCRQHIPVFRFIRALLSCRSLRLVTLNYSRKPIFAIGKMFKLNLLHRYQADALFPLCRTDVMYRSSLRIDRDRHRHIFHFEFVDRFHTQIGKRQHFRAADGFGH